MLFLYNMPTWLMGLVVVCLTVLAALLGYLVARRIRLVELDAEQRAMTLTMVSIITTINSLLVAFAAISVWDAYNDAEHTVAAEATCAGELARDLAAFGTPPADLAGDALRAYTEQLVSTEWHVMQTQAQGDPETQHRFDILFNEANQIVPTNPRQNALLTEVLIRMNEMVKHRQQRLMTLNAHLPITLWAVMVVVSALSFAMLYVLPGTAFHTFLIGGWAATLGLAFFFVLAVDRPFAGEVSVSAHPFRETIQELVLSKTWKTTVAAVPEND